MNFADILVRAGCAPNRVFVPLARRAVLCGVKRELILLGLGLHAIGEGQTIMPAERQAMGDDGGFWYAPGTVLYHTVTIDCVNCEGVRVEAKVCIKGKILDWGAGDVEHLEKMRPWQLYDTATTVTVRNAIKALPVATLLNRQAAPAALRKALGEVSLAHTYHEFLGIARYSAEARCT